MTVLFGVARNLSTNIILGTQFLELHKAVIDCGSGKIHLQKPTQMRVKDKQKIAPHSQYVIIAKISGQRIIGSTGLCRGGRHISALGVLVANTVCIN